ncbi:RibD family protein [Catalinimonas niigatensis]|uniref:RibD family protein n=1 Tax=Catalinimonas niigatensis TaxID=1397264 RepID=UPI002666DB47|nr:RibD family protein [Catalinimonas niigatensis]WPP51648.1 RibD family protein [Catalinimonas niigatensis]
MEIEDYWLGILMLAEKVKHSEENIDYCFLQLGAEPEVRINHLPVPVKDSLLLMIIANPELEMSHEQASVFRLDTYTVHIVQNMGLPEEAKEFLTAYLPYCFLPLQARKMGRAVAITHFAQSLDGRIATQSGDSKWIGNEENLVHAHRMRALCDSILIGANTLNFDQPALTVRLVEGKNPQRIVICSSDADFSSLQEKCKDDVIIVGTCDDPQIPQTEYFPFEPNAKGRIDCHALLRFLYQRSLYSVYIEGGSATTSGFMEEKATDIVQLHIAPIIFGSGVSSFNLTEITHVQQAVQFDSFFFRPMGNTYMFVGAMNVGNNA